MRDDISHSNGGSNMSVVKIRRQEFSLALDFSVVTIISWSTGFPITNYSVDIYTATFRA